MYTKGSYFRLSARASIPVYGLEPTLKVQSYNNILAHKVKNIDGKIKLEH